MILGFVLVFSPEIADVDNVHWGVAPTWANLAIAIPVAMLAYTGVETVSNLAEEAREPERSVPNALQARRRGHLHDLPHAAADRAVGAAGRRRSTASYTTLLALPPEEGGYANDPILGVVENLGVEGALLDVLQIYVGCSRRRSSSSRRTPGSSAPRGSRTRWRPTGRSRRSSAGSTHGSRRRTWRSSSSPGSRRS